MKKRVVVIAASTMLATSMAAWACGPFFPNAYLTFGEERAVLNMPEASFFNELAVIFDQDSTHQPRTGWFDKKADAAKRWQRTLDADVADLEAALNKRGLKAEKAASLTREYRAMRDAMNLYANPHRDEPEPALYAQNPNPKPEETATPTTPFDFKPYKAVLRALPTEFALYVRGASSYYARDYKGAEKQWKKLLALPKKRREYRSTWAAFMIGKLRLTSDPKDAIRWFEQTRDLAKAGFCDSLNPS